MAAAVPESLVQRLEAVAAKLEAALASSSSGSSSHPGTATGSSSAPRPEAPHAAAAAAPAAAGVSSLGAYDKLVRDALEPLAATAASIGGEVHQVTQHIQQAFLEQRSLLAWAANTKRPSQDQLQEALQPVAAQMVAAQGMSDNRRAVAHQQLKVASEALQGLGWLAYTGPACGMAAPAQHVKDSWSAAEFYANKLLMQYRGSDEAQVAWVKGLKELMQQLEGYVRAHHPQGITWNPQGAAVTGSAAAAVQAAAAAAPAQGAPPPPPPAAPAPAAAAAAGGAGPKAPPPPPPPPPPGLLLKERPAAAPAPAAGGAGGGRAELLKALQKGDGITSGLRKVTDDMKSKNRDDRSGLVSAPAKPAAAAAAAAAAAPKAAQGPPRLELQQERKWMVENHSGNPSVLVDRTDPRHAVYVYNCAQSVVQVKGKVNTISLDRCSRVGLVFEDVIATVELVNCQRVQVQCTGAMPTVSIDKCDGCQVFVPASVAANPDFQVVTAKSSEVNVVVVPANPEQEDAKEHAVPEQFVSSFKNGKLVTVAASHGGG